MKKFYISLVLSIFALTAWSQEYLQMIAAGTYTVEEIQDAAEAYYAVVGKDKGKGYTPYRRWEYQALRNMDETGKLKSSAFLYEELQRYNNYENLNFYAARTAVGNWEQLGPVSWNATSGWNPGVGRVTSLAVQSSNANHIIVGGETGGVWKTIDGGSTWNVLTDNLSNLSVNSLAMHPTNINIYYWGSTGGTIFRSINGGATWNVLSTAGYGNVNKIIIDPNNPTKMYCSVQGGGIYKSSNSGASWTIITGTAPNGYDVEFKPGDPNTVYASGNGFFKSNNGGITFTSISGFSTGPKMIGVSANAASTVYVVEASGGVFGGFYKSVNSGSSFNALNHAGMNYFGYESDGSDDRGQAPRDMDIAVNPANVNDVHIAGINTWRSTNGGITFSISSQWTPQNAALQGVGYCHADVDIMEYVGDKLFVGTDGGIYVANNPTNVNASYYTDLTAGLGIRQFYKIGVSQTNPVAVSGGSQDNGTSLMYNGNWIDWLGADGMETFVDKNNNNILYGTSQYGTLYKSSNGGTNYNNVSAPDGKGGQNTWNWVVPFEQDPIVLNTIYVAFDLVYKSIDGGASWLPISQNFGGNIDELKIAPSDNNIIYMASDNFMYKTTDGGTTNWSQLSGFSGNINSIAVHPTDPNKIAIATTGTQKVYVSVNGGSSWTSYLNDLPNFNARALAWQNNGEDGLYLGMNYGVYYIDNTTSNSWQPFSNNLPNVNISELEINTAENKIYVATYGRGLWRSDLFDDALSLNEFALNAMQVYPNPAKTEIYLSWDKGEDVSVRVFNTLGKLMYYAKNETLLNPLKIDISQYSSGLYFVKVNTQNGVVTKKVMVD